MDHMTRRQCITLIAGAAVAWPLAVRAQQRKIYRLGVLADVTPALDGLFYGLRDFGYVEGENLIIYRRPSEGRAEQWSKLAAELVALSVDAIVVSTTPAALAAKKATGTIPIIFPTALDLVGVGLAVILCSSSANLTALVRATRSINVVFVLVSDPVAQGFVSNLAHPGGNITGFSAFEPSMAGKWLDLLKQASPGHVTGITLMSGEIVSKRIALLRDLLPNAKKLAVLMNATTPASSAEVAVAERVADTLGWQVKVLKVGSELDFEAAFQPLPRERADALLVTTDPIFESQRDRIVALAASHTIPAIYALREYALAGGLMTYGASITYVYRQAGMYVGRILNGETAADLPVMQASKFDLVVNLKTAKMLGIQFSPALLAVADEVIE